MIAVGLLRKVKGYRSGGCDRDRSEGKSDWCVCLRLSRSSRKQTKMEKKEVVRVAAALTRSEGIDCMCMYIIVWSVNVCPKLEIRAACCGQRAMDMPAGKLSNSSPLIFTRRMTKTGFCRGLANAALESTSPGRTLFSLDNVRGQ